jgi:class 3 adenylate cyclase
VGGGRERSLTALGDSVNIASRLEQGNRAKEWMTRP